jgi:beta-phosphoglucomutase-like phosphatase (HAD superfamily)
LWQNKKYKTVIFDMDGVVDTEPVHRYAYFQHFEELNIKVTEEMFTFYWKLTRNVFQNLKTIFNLDQEVKT